MDERKPEIEQKPDWREGKTPEEIAKLEETGRRVTEYYSQPEENIPPPDGNEHEEGLILKDLIEKNPKKD